MNRRFLIFYTIVLVILLTTSFLQNLYFPAEPRSANGQKSAQVDQENPSSKLASETGQDDETGLDAAKGLGGDEEADSGSANQSGPTTQKDIADEESGLDDPAPFVDSDLVRPQEKVREPDSFYTIGSIAADRPYRYLVTIDPRGGAIRRMELNYRDGRKRYKYRDFEHQGGYLGELDCIDTVRGCRIRAVGDGTPAAVAGLKVGDIVQSVGSEPVASSGDLLRILSKTRPGKTLSLQIVRETASEPITASVRLTHKPIELLRPEPDILNVGLIAKPSFRTTLRLQSDDVVWPELDPAMMDGMWQIDSVDDSSISLSYEVSSAVLAMMNLPDMGPLRIVKRYSLQADRSIDVDTTNRNFDMQLQWSIENLGSKPIEVCYQLQGPLGTPSETWWYQNKIHARTWAIGYIAGARDVIGSTAQEEFTFFGGPEMVGNAIKPQPKYFWLLRPPVDKNESTQQVRFLSVDTQYFNVALLPEKNGEPFSAYSVLADVTQDKLPKEVKKQKLVDCTFQMFKVVAVGASQKYQQSFEIFAGPKEPAILAQYGLDGVRSFGWFAWFSIPLCWLLEMFHTITFKLGYGIPIILLTVLVRCLMIPISRKAAINAQMMQHLAPQMKEIADKYKDDMEKRGQAQRDLFRKYRYNPFGGCFMMFLQIPIFIGLYRGLSVEIALRDQPLFPGLGWCTNLAAPDQLWYWKDWFPGFMSFLTDETGWLGPYLNILPIITCVLFVVQQKMFTPPPTDEQQEMMHKVMKYMTIFMGFLFFKVPSGLCLYFITSSVWGIIERKMLPKPELDKERLHQLESAGNTAPSVLNKLQLKQRAKAEQAQQKRDAAFEERKRLDRLRKKRLRNRDA